MREQKLTHQNRIKQTDKRKEKRPRKDTWNRYKAKMNSIKRHIKSVRCVLLAYVDYKTRKNPYYFKVVSYQNSLNDFKVVSSVYSTLPQFLWSEHIYVSIAT